MKAEEVEAADAMGATHFLMKRLPKLLRTLSQSGLGAAKGQIRTHAVQQILVTSAAATRHRCPQCTPENVRIGRALHTNPT
jgi:hypothetical protein